MQIRRKRFAQARLFVSGLFDALALAEWCVSVVSLAAYFAGPPRPAFELLWRVGFLCVAAAVVVQGLLFAALKWAESRVELPPEAQPKKGYRGFQGGTAPKLSQRARRRMLSGLLGAG